MIGYKGGIIHPPLPIYSGPLFLPRIIPLDKAALPPDNNYLELFSRCLYIYSANPKKIEYQVRLRLWKILFPVKQDDCSRLKPLIPGLGDIENLISKCYED